MKKNLSQKDIQIEQRLFRTDDVSAVDHLIKITKGAHTIEGERGWAIVGKAFEWWTRRWPEEWEEFLESVEAIRQTRLNKEGMSISGEIKYVGALPWRFERILRVLFPMQQFDKEFIYKLIDKIKVTRVGEKRDTWFTI